MLLYLRHADDRGEDVYRHDQTLEVVTLDEDRKGFRHRVSDHVKDMRIRSITAATIWVITHQVVIEEAAEHFGVKLSGRLDFLDYVVMLR